MGTVSASPPFVAERFFAERFFAGRLDGVGTLKIVLHAPVTTHVSSVGRLGADGTLVLD